MIGWGKRFGSAAISSHFPNADIERFTRSRGGVIPYRILVGLDIVTREMEEEGVKQIRLAEQARDAAQKEGQAAGRAAEEAKRLLVAALKKQQTAEVAEEKAKCILVAILCSH